VVTRDFLKGLQVEARTQYLIPEPGMVITGTDDGVQQVPFAPGPGETTFNADGSISSTSGIPATTTFNPDGSITTVYAAPLNRTIRTVFNADGSITEEQV